MNVSLEVKELGNPLEQYGIKRSFTIRMLVGVWLVAFIAAIFIALAVMIATNPDLDGAGSTLVGVFALCAVAAVILSAVIVWYMAGRRVTVYERGIYARTRLGGKVFRWEDLDGIVTDIKETTRHAPSYSSFVDVDPTSIVDDIVGLVFEAAVSRDREAGSTKTYEHYRLYVNGEEVLKIGGNYKDVYQLVHSIEKQITDIHLPRLLERWQQGEIVTVAKFSFEPDLVRRLGVIVKWADLQEVVAFGGDVTCILKDANRVKLSGPSTGEINQHMVTPLMKAIHRASQA